MAKSSSEYFFLVIAFILLLLILYYFFLLQSKNNGKLSKSSIQRLDKNDEEKYIKDEYLVLMQPWSSVTVWKKHLQDMNALFEQHTRKYNKPPGTNAILNAWSIGPHFKAYHVRSDDVKYWIDKARSHPAVATIERNSLRHIAESLPCDVEQLAPWQLQRIQYHNPDDMNGMYSWSYDGEGVDAYVMDTGIRANHVEFGDRVVVGPNFTGDGNDADANGHGTHVAAILGGQHVGVARGVRLIAVKILDAQGEGTSANLLSALNWIASDYKKKNRRAVINFSLGGAKSTTENAATAVLVNMGVVVLAAGGNENQDACLVSPASEPKVITVGATTENDDRANFSNWGKCIDIFAPGVNVESAHYEFDKEYQVFSGTSQATPYVSGVVALLLQAHPTLSPAAIKKRLFSDSTKKAINMNCSGQCAQKTPNRLLYTKPCVF